MKEDREMIAPLGDAEEPKIPFKVTSMEKTGPYPTKPRGNLLFLLLLIISLSLYKLFPFQIILPKRVREFTQAKSLVVTLQVRH
jgi:hypothetical protein